MLLPDQVCDLVTKEFDKLPSKGKPLVRSNGIKEWTVLAGIVAHNIDNEGGTSDKVFEPKCVALATGVKATPDKFLAKARGMVIHDMHAEILVKRVFNWFILSECNAIYNGEASDILTVDYKLRKNIGFSLYISEAPCGDASMSLTRNLERESPEKDEEWTSDPKFFPGTKTLRGRAHFHHVGYVRTKPGRNDSQTTLSKSCSDKLLMTQFTSLLSAPVSRLVSAEGFFLAQLVVPESQFDAEDFARAFRTRSQSISSSDIVAFGTDPPPHKRVKRQDLGDIPATYFDFGTTSIPFKYSRTIDAKPCLASIVYCPSTKDSEVVLQGVKMGNKMYSAKGASFVCRKSIAETALAILSKKDNYQPSPAGTYNVWKKASADRESRKRAVREALGEWVSTATDDFELA